MKTLREIRQAVAPSPDYSPTETSCPKCGGTLHRGPVPCPDGKPGCLVAHIGYKCSGCSAYFVAGEVRP